MDINGPGSEDHDAKCHPMDTTSVKIHSPPKMNRATRKAGAIEQTSDRTDSVNGGEEANNVTPRTVESKTLRKNKDPKRIKMQQTRTTFMKKLEKNKQERSQHNVVAQVEGKRLKPGKRLVPSRLTAKLLSEKAARSRKEAEDADEEEVTNKTISFGTGNSNSKTGLPIKSALKKGPREKIKAFKYNLVVDVRVKISYTRKKNEVRKQVCNCLGGSLNFIRETLLEGKLEVAFLGKEGR